MRRPVTAAQRIRGMCMVLLAAENDKALLRLFPRFREVLQEFQGELKAKRNGVWQSVAPEPPTSGSFLSANPSSQTAHYGAFVGLTGE
jgi:hypothetical protein